MEDNLVAAVFRVLHNIMLWVWQTWYGAYTQENSVLLSTGSVLSRYIQEVYIIS